MKIYAESSFLVSLYSPDANSAAASRTMQASTGECFRHYSWGTGSRQCFRIAGLSKRSFAAQARRVALTDFEKDLRDGVFQFRSLSEPFFERARQLSQQTTAKLGTRTADLLHVAAALELGADYLYSFDQQQRKLAQAVRLKLN